MLNNECGWKEWRQIGGGLQTIRKMRMDARQRWKWNQAGNTERSACHFLGLPIIWISATLPGCPAARFARPGRGPYVIPTDLLIREKMAGSVLALIIAPPVGRHRTSCP